MAFIPANGLEIYGSFVTSGTYTPVNGLEIYGDFSGDVAVSRRALLVSGAGFRQISDDEIGEGLKYVTDSSGRALVFVSGGLRTLGDSETLLI